MFISRQAFTQASKILFARDNICHWKEPDLPLSRYPSCTFKNGENPLTHPGDIIRAFESELDYVLINGQMDFGPNAQILNESIIPQTLQCGVNYPSPDNITPNRMESFIWAFSKGFVIGKKCLGLTRLSSNWQNMDCERLTATAASCRDITNPRSWRLSAAITSTAAAEEACQSFGPNFMFSAPASGYENQLVFELLTNNARVTQVILNTENI